MIFLKTSFLHQKSLFLNQNFTKKKRNFSDFSRFFARWSWFAKFQFLARRKVDRTCPTQHFLTSWGSGEYVGSRVGHHRAGLRPLRPGFLKFPDRRLRCHFGFWGPVTWSRPRFRNCPSAREHLKEPPLKGQLSQKFVLLAQMEKSLFDFV